jgi:hypothetical protein
MYNIFVYLPSLVITGQYITHRFLISTQGHKRVKSKKKKRIVITQGGNDSPYELPLSSFGDHLILIF